MQYMRIKTGEHEGVPQYSTVPVEHYLSVRTDSELESKLKDGYQVIEFEHELTQVKRMNSRYPVHMARLK